jgi:selenoprotein W-related protein
LTEEVLKDREIERFVGSWRLIPGSGGVFEVTVNGELLYSKKQSGRHAEPGEVKQLIEKKLAAVRAQRPPIPDEDED